jgi:hypothetical protein
MNGIQVMLQAFDQALSHPFESFVGAVKNLSEEESVWQHPAYSREPHDEGIGRPGTVLWFLNHLEFCHRTYTAILKTRPVEKWPEVDLPGELALKPALAALTKANAGLRAEIANLTDADPASPCVPNNPTSEFLHGVIRHIVWHSGQIATIRRLHARR